MSLNFAILRQMEIISGQKKTTVKILQCGFCWPIMFKDSHAFCKTCENYQKVGFISKHKESLDNLLLTFGTYPSGNVHCAFHNL